MNQRGIIHSDLKESNILISYSKSNETDPLCACLPLSFKIADLGIAKDLVQSGGAEKLLLTSGTPKYMAPE
jgi:serine/threonine protein kinase